jgi:hypothetical protein
MGATSTIRSRRLAVAAVLVLLVVVSPARAGADLPAHWSPKRACPDVFVVGVRGSGETRGLDGADPDRGFGPRAVVVFDRLLRTLGTAGVRTAPVSVDYPALGVGEAALGFFDTRSAGFGASIEAGSSDLAGLMATTRSACPRAVHVIVGYSQGAEVIRRALATGGIPEGDDLAAIVLISDLRFDAADAGNGVNLRGTYDPQRRGVRHSMSPLPPAPWIAARTFSVCNRLDIGCQFSQGGLPVGLFTWRTGRDVHLGYGPTDLDPVVRAEVLPLVRERLDVASWRRFVLLPL